MTLPPSLQTLLERLPLQGADILVDALFDDRTEATEFIDALRTAVGKHGTIVMATFTQSQTLSCESPDPVAFHRDIAVDTRLGVLPEVFRHQATTLRTDHPTNSFAATGESSQVVLSTNRDNNPMGPIKKLSLMNGFALCLGQPLSACTALHLAEEQSLPALRYRGTAKRINISGFEERAVIEHAASCTAGYHSLGEAVGAATAAEFPSPADATHFLPLRTLVHEARVAINAAPESILCGREQCVTCDQRSAFIHRNG